MSREISAINHLSMDWWKREFGKPANHGQDAQVTNRRLIRAAGPGLGGSGNLMAGAPQRKRPSRE